MRKRVKGSEAVGRGMLSGPPLLLRGRERDEGMVTMQGMRKGNGFAGQAGRTGSIAVVGWENGRHPLPSISNTSFLKSSGVNVGSGKHQPSSPGCY